MPAIHRTALMPYSASQMFSIVNDVTAYPDFLPWCASSRILQQTGNTMEATILMRKGKLNHSFSTRNEFREDQIIHIELVNGPFKKLTGDWLFTPISEQGCKIELKLEFQFSNRLMSVLIGPVFTQIANSLVDAFCQRAHQLYTK